MGILFSTLVADAKKFLAPVATPQMGACGKTPKTCCFWRDGQFPCDCCPEEN